MSETRGLLDRVAALRRDHEHPPVVPAPSAVSADRGGAAARLAALQKQVTAAGHCDAVTDRTIRQVGRAPEHTPAPAGLPKQLTAQTRRLLDQGRTLVGQLRALADHAVLQQEDHPLTSHYREASAMAEAVLWLLQGLPDSPGDQLRLCAGLEALVQAVAERVNSLADVLAQLRAEDETIGALAEALDHIHRDVPFDPERIPALAEALLDEARRDAPLRFLDPKGAKPARWVACHSLNVARVAARLARADPDFRSHARAVVLAALWHDVGMLALPPQLLAGRGPLDGEQRRLVEAHTRTGAELLRRRFGAEPHWLAEAAAGHHERADGTGYPGGLRSDQTPPVARLLAVCDVYAALRCHRPYRAALEPRQALAETLRHAERGGLDARLAGRLLALSFYPVGTAVELADGSLGVVVGSGLGRSDARAAGRPVVAVVVNANGQALAEPRHVDLARADDESIVRALSADERRTRLGGRAPRWAW